MKKTIGKWLRRAQPRVRGTLPLVLLVMLLGGCATGGKIDPQPAAELPPLPQGPTVSRFEDGRTGFVLREIATMDEAARRDFERGVTRLQAEDFEAAIELFDRVLERSPGVSAPYIDLAMAYRRIDRPELAEEYLRTALKLLPGHPVASHEYGLLLREAGRFTEARAVYEQSLEEFPEYLPVRRNLGILCDLYLNDRDCALEQYQTYSASSPGDEQVRLWISDLRLRLGQ